MIKQASGFAAVVTALLLLSAGTQAEPIVLKAAYFSSDRASAYEGAIRPFVEAVNAEAKETFRIEVFPGGVLGPSPLDQAQLVLNGVADIAFVIPGYTPDLFPDDAVIELPGLYRDAKEATLTFLNLATDGVLRGYDKFFVIGVIATQPETIHTRPPVASLDDLAGKRIRVNNPIEGAAIEELGAVPVLLPVNHVATAIAAGEIDGGTMPASDFLIEFGVARIAANHYMLKTSAVPLALLMNRQAFDRLPDAARKIILNNSGKVFASRYLKFAKSASERVAADLLADQRRNVVEPSNDDLERARAAFDLVIQDWLAADVRNPGLLAKAKAALAEME